MIDAVDTQLKDWATAVVEGPEVRFDLPSKADGESVVLYLCRLEELPATRNPRQTSFNVMLHYVVFVCGQDPLQAHKRLGALLQSAMANPRMDVVLGDMDLSAWNAMGLPPQPSFGLRVPMPMPQPQPEAPLVSQVSVRSLPTKGIRGMVLGPNGTPIAGARVELTGLGKRTRTDERGRFAFGAVPADDAHTSFRVAARGATTQMKLTEAELENGRYTIHHQLPQED